MADVQENDADLVAESLPDDSDSTFEQDEQSSSASITSSILAFKEENGRRYHALSAGKYVLPNDEAENERLDLQHYLFLLSLDGRLALCPKEDGASRVLDIGTGTGIWSMEYADMHPEAEVIGVDLSPIQPLYVPPNCKFEIDDLEKPWTWTVPFDFIFCRMMLGSFQDFPSIIKTAYENLEPGGYLEVQDMTILARSDDGTLPPGSSLLRWGHLIHEAAANAGRPVFPVTEYKKYLLDAGFEDVVEVVKKWPTNQWPRDQRFKELGALTFGNIGNGLEGLTLAHFTRGLGWTKEQTLLFCTEVRKDLRSLRMHAYFPIYFVYGRKPGRGEGNTPAGVAKEKSESPRSE